MYKRLINIDLNQKLSVFLFGARGTGKTMWLQQYLPDALYFDLLNAKIYNQLISNPERLENMIPSGYTGWIVIDEVQKIPEILNEVHRLIEHKSCRFILTGSSSRTLKRKGVNLLAGRALHYFMHPLTIIELAKDFSLSHALKYGTLPTVTQTKDPKHYLETYLMTYLREEILQEGLLRNLGEFTRFLEIASFSQGSTINYSEIAREVSIDRKTVSEYFSMTEDLLIGVLLPAFKKRAKRKVYSQPKFYFFDTGVFRTIRPRGPLDSVEEAEGPALETLLLQHLRAYNDYNRLGYTLYYWRTSSGVEVDFVLYGENGLVAFEVKRKAKINKQDFSGLSLFKQDYPMANCYLLYGGDEPEYHEEFTVLPFEKALLQLPELLKS